MTKKLSASEILKKAQKKAERERWEKHLERDLIANKVIGWTREYKFHPERDWRFDFAWTEIKLAVEVDGAIWIKGGHNTGVGRTNDMEKDEAALLNGWTVYRCSPEMVKKGHAIDTIKKLINLKTNPCKDD